MIQFRCKYAVLCSAPVLIGLLIADKHIKRFFFLRDSQYSLLNFIYCCRFGFIKLPLLTVGTFYRRFIILVIENRCELCPVHRRNSFVCCRILNVFYSVSAQDDRPVAFRILSILIENLFINAHCLVKIIIPAEMICPIKKICLFLIVKSGKGLLRPAILTCCNCQTGIYLKRSAAYFAFEHSHSSILPFY